MQNERHKKRFFSSSTIQLTLLRLGDVDFGKAIVQFLQSFFLPPPSLGAATESTIGVGDVAGCAETHG